MKIHFVREGTGTAPDQPYLFEWLESAHFDNIKFAAILGNPVTQSMTPSEQGPFFNQYNMPVLKLMLSEKDLTAKSLEILYDLGLRAAAVTSPLKQVMFNLSTKLSKNAAELEAVNTVLLEKNKELIIYGENTDLFGLEELISYANAQFEFQKPGFEVVLWGGGGVRSSVKKLLPQLKTYSARNAKPLTCQDKVTEPKVIIWAVGRSRQEACKWPLEKFKPSLIIDLNYTMDSPGREYALRVGAKYVSGLKMFEKQADLQRQFWKGKL